MVDRACQRPKTSPVGVHVVVHGTGQIGATVVAVVQDSHLGATRVFASDFDRIFHGFGTGVDQHGFFGEVSRCVFGE